MIVAVAFAMSCLLTWLSGPPMIAGLSHRPVNAPCDRSAEGEAVGLGARLEELDLDEALLDSAGFADELIQALLGQGALPLLVDIEPVGGARHHTVQLHP